MKKTKENILLAALQLFNDKGVADISIRQIAKAAGISHGNLIYHYKTKSDIIQGIHQIMLNKAFEINQAINRYQFDISTLYNSTKAGFEVVYEFRFLFYDMLYITKTDPVMQKILLEIEQVRKQMYKEVIELSVTNKLMQAESFPGEYDGLITRIKIFSDHWLSSSAIYDGQHKPDIDRYVKLFMEQFYPYLTEKGKSSLKFPSP